jgi:hypothetical protein
MKKPLSVLAAAFLVSISLQAQVSLTASGALPKPDGQLGPNEYQYNATVSGMQLGATLGTDGMLYLSIQAKTAGWVALGVGGRMMNGSRLFIGFDAPPKPVFTEQKGIGHSHVDAADSVVSRWAVKQADGSTTLELVLPAKAAVVSGSVDLLFAYSDATAITMRHKARGSMSLSIKG